MTCKNIITVGFNPAIDYMVQCAGFGLGRVNSGRALARIAAGKAVNVTRALALLGQDVLAMGWIGDSDQLFFREQLHKLEPGAVACNFNILPQAVRQNITILDGSTDTHVRMKGFAVTESDITEMENHLLTTIQEGDAVIFSGSLPEGLSPERFGVILDKALARGAKVAVDAEGPALEIALGKALWIAKPNVEELAEAWHEKPMNTVREIMAAATRRVVKVENLVISRGKNGAVLMRAEDCFNSEAPDGGQVIRTVACGDHLLAGFIDGLCHGKEPSAALRQGLALATARAVSENLEIFDATKYSALLQQVEL